MFCRICQRKDNLKFNEKELIREIKKQRRIGQQVIRNDLNIGNICLDCDYRLQNYQHLPNSDDELLDVDGEGVDGTFGLTTLCEDDIKSQTNENADEKNIKENHNNNEDMKLEIVDLSFDSDGSDGEKENNNNNMSWNQKRKMQRRLTFDESNFRIVGCFVLSSESESDTTDGDDDDGDGADDDEEGDCEAECDNGNNDEGIQSTKNLKETEKLLEKNTPPPTPTPTPVSAPIIPIPNHLSPTSSSSVKETKSFLENSLKEVNPPKEEKEKIENLGEEKEKRDKDRESISKNSLFIPLNCPDCNLRFLDQETLKLHSEIHSIDNISCPCCDLLFTIPLRLVNHMRRKHLSYRGPILNEHPCLSTDSPMTIRLRYKEKENFYECQLCGRIDDVYKIHKDHILTSHPHEAKSLRSHHKKHKNNIKKEEFSSEDEMIPLKQYINARKSETKRRSSIKKQQFEKTIKDLEKSSHVIKDKEKGKRKEKEKEKDLVKDSISSTNMKSVFNVNLSKDFRNSNEAKSLKKKENNLAEHLDRPNDLPNVASNGKLSDDLDLKNLNDCSQLNQVTKNERNKIRPSNEKKQLSKVSLGDDVKLSVDCHRPKTKKSVEPFQKLLNNSEKKKKPGEPSIKLVNHSKKKSKSKELSIKLVNDSGKKRKPEDLTTKLLNESESKSKPEKTSFQLVNGSENKKEPGKLSTKLVNGVEKKSKPERLSIKLVNASEKKQGYGDSPTKLVNGGDKRIKPEESSFKLANGSEKKQDSKELSTKLVNGVEKKSKPERLSIKLVNASEKKQGSGESPTQLVNGGDKRIKPEESSFKLANGSEKKQDSKELPTKLANDGRKKRESIESSIKLVTASEKKQGSGESPTQLVNDSEKKSKLEGSSMKLVNDSERKRESLESSFKLVNGSEKKRESGELPTKHVNDSERKSKAEKSSIILVMNDSDKKRESLGSSSKIVNDSEKRKESRESFSKLSNDTERKRQSLESSINLVANETGKKRKQGESSIKLVNASLNDTKTVSSSSSLPSSNKELFLYPNSKNLMIDDNDVSYDSKKRKSKDKSLFCPICKLNCGLEKFDICRHLLTNHILDEYKSHLREINPDKFRSKVTNIQRVKKTAILYKYGKCHSIYYQCRSCKYISRDCSEHLKHSRSHLIKEKIKPNLENHNTKELRNKIPIVKNNSFNIRLKRGKHDSKTPEIKDIITSLNGKSSSEKSFSKSKDESIRSNKNENNDEIKLRNKKRLNKAITPNIEREENRLLSKIRRKDVNCSSFPDLSLTSPSPPQKKRKYSFPSDKSEGSIKKSKLLTSSSTKNPSTKNPSQKDLESYEDSFTLNDDSLSKNVKSNKREELIMKGGKISKKAVKAALIKVKVKPPIRTIPFIQRPCKFCPFLANTFMGYNKHMLHNHSQEEFLQCPKCFQVFFKPTFLKNHFCSKLSDRKMKKRDRLNKLSEKEFKNSSESNLSDSKNLQTPEDSGDEILQDCKEFEEENKNILPSLPAKTLLQLFPTSVSCMKCGSLFLNQKELAQHDGDNHLANEPERILLNSAIP